MEKLETTPCNVCNQRHPQEVEPCVSIRNIGIDIHRLEDMPKEDFQRLTRQEQKDHFKMTQDSQIKLSELMESSSNLHLKAHARQLIETAQLLALWIGAYGKKPTGEEEDAYIRKLQEETQRNRELLKKGAG